jgi:hypothetical protein
MDIDPPCHRFICNHSEMETSSDIRPHVNLCLSVTVNQTKDLSKHGLHLAVYFQASIDENDEMIL